MTQTARQVGRYQIFITQLRDTIEKEGCAYIPDCKNIKSITNYLHWLGTDVKATATYRHKNPQIICNEWGEPIDLTDSMDVFSGYKLEKLYK